VGPYFLKHTSVSKGPRAKVKGRESSPLVADCFRPNDAAPIPRDPCPIQFSCTTCCKGIVGSQSQQPIQHTLADAYFGRLRCSSARFGISIEVRILQLIVVCEHYGPQYDERHEIPQLPSSPPPLPSGPKMHPFRALGGILWDLISRTGCIISVSYVVVQTGLHDQAQSPTFTSFIPEPSCPLPPLSSPPPEPRVYKDRTPFCPTPLPQHGASVAEGSTSAAPA
jgi:hypothetical protein